MRWIIRHNPFMNNRWQDYKNNGDVLFKDIVQRVVGECIGGFNIIVVNGRIIVGAVVNRSLGPAES